MEIIAKVMSYLQGSWAQILAAGIVLNVEYILGKTNKVKANSTLELVLNGLRLVAGKIMALKKPKA